MKSRGLGDTIHNITKATGIKKVVDTVSKATGKGCGCTKRREALNKAFPYKSNQPSNPVREINLSPITNRAKLTEDAMRARIRSYNAKKNKV